MKSAKAFILFVLFNALLSVGMTSIYAAQAKHSGRARGGEALSHKQPRESAPSHHQWLADPERGWVRRQETERAKDQRSTPKRRNQSGGTSNNRGKKF